MASRLDRLFVLLETGSTPSTRKAAAQQLGQVQKLHPHELPFLLYRVHKCLRSSSWETRVAAGQAVEAIVGETIMWDPVKIKKEGSDDDVADTSYCKEREGSGKGKFVEFLKFATFDIKELLEKGNYLMASEAKVFEDEGAMNGNSEKQRSLINKKLGLDIAEKIGIDTSDIITNEDLDNGSFSKSESSIEQSMESFDSNSGMDSESVPLSSREMNLAKRRARKQKSKETESQESSQTRKRLKREDSLTAEIQESDGTFKFFAISDDTWILSGWVDMLLRDLLNSNWEIRHGAATALREIVRLRGFCGGKIAGKPAAEVEKLHEQWLEHMGLMFLSVLAMDRFGDYVSDQVVAPVRETCAQCLGNVINLMNDSSVLSLVKVMIQLLEQNAWEARHGGLLGFKYLFAVKKNLVSQLLPMSFTHIFKSLSDSVDDVCAVAASALIPVAKEIAQILPTETSLVVSVLWDSLADLDDLSSACNSIMGLLAQLLAFPVARKNLRDLDTLIPRLWPFLHHTSSSVRKSALFTLQKLTELDAQVTPLSITPLQETLRHVFQRAVVESNADVLGLIPPVWRDLIRSSEFKTLLMAACPQFGTWLCLSMYKASAPIDSSYLIKVTNRKNSKASLNDSITEEDGQQKVFFAGNEEGDPDIVAQTRIILGGMLGNLSPYLVKPMHDSPPGSETPIECYVKMILFHLSSRSALQRTMASMVVSAWPVSTPGDAGIGTDGSIKCNPELVKKLLFCLTESIYFDEIALTFSKLQRECQDFVSTLKHYKIPLEGKNLESIEKSAVTAMMFSFEQVQVLCSNEVEEVVLKATKKGKTQDILLERRKALYTLWLSTTSEFNALNTTTLATIASALCSIPGSLPEKLRPVVKPLMESIRKESVVLYQRESSRYLCRLMSLVITRDQNPVPKIVQNLVASLCSDSKYLKSIEQKDGIMSWSLLSCEESVTKKNKVGAEEKDSQSVLQKRGATICLKEIVRFFEAKVDAQISKLWEVTFGVLEDAKNLQGNCTKAAIVSVVNALEILQVIAPEFHVDLYPQLESKIPILCKLLCHECLVIRHMASRCLATCAEIIPEKVMPIIAKTVIPLLSSQDLKSRQGAIECIYCVVDFLSLKILPYIVLLIIPVLARMSDQDDSVRMLASLTFATLVRLMPLEGGVPDPVDLPKDLVQRKIEQREFLEQLLDPSKIAEYKISVPIQAELRPYQQSGVNWLGFLNKFKLHGILADDLGLGKTLQTICILANDHKLQTLQNKKCAPSLVICPPTLTGHWVYEVEKFVSKEYLKCLHYHGPPADRARLKPKLSSHNLIVSSYDLIRNDIEFFSAIHWNYCILDEGHIIKNGKTKISKAIKQLKCDHRLILSGTPIQNNVLELWSLFDFLMPGFLGTEKQFASKFAKPILQARDPKSSPKDQEAGALAMEALHRQALPFLLRRLKEDVLKDLPPKITQDYYCELSTIQEELYDDFARTRVHQSLRDTFHSVDDSTKNSHIFQALQYLRKVCNHPKLVLTPQHPKYVPIVNHLQETKSSLNDIHHSGKLPALKQLLLDIGIGSNQDLSNCVEGIGVVNQHRALIFCQLKTMLDIIENDLLKLHLPSVTYLRLDGSVPAGQRHSLVTRFNNDPTIDILLLTTQVGGLGLCLTGADTVIFVEHDWNPMRDLQAMDRAHRIGQKKVVNVYRLITRGTLEEKIMGLQKFKMMTANTVISQDNACMDTMATDQILDLFLLEDGSDKKEDKRSDVGNMVGVYKNVLESMPELWEDKLYEEEYDLSGFIKNLGK